MFLLASYLILASAAAEQIIYRKPSFAASTISSPTLNFHPNIKKNVFKFLFCCGLKEDVTKSQSKRGGGGTGHVYFSNLSAPQLFYFMF